MQNFVNWELIPLDFSVSVDLSLPLGFFLGAFVVLQPLNCVRVGAISQILQLQLSPLGWRTFAMGDQSKNSERGSKKSPF